MKILNIFNEMAISRKECVIRLKDEFLRFILAHYIKLNLIRPEFSSMLSPTAHGEPLVYKTYWENEIKSKVLELFTFFKNHPLKGGTVESAYEEACKDFEIFSDDDKWEANRELFIQNTLIKATSVIDSIQDRERKIEKLSKKMRDSILWTLPLKQFFKDIMPKRDAVDPEMVSKVEKMFKDLSKDLGE